MKKQQNALFSNTAVQNIRQGRQYFRVFDPPQLGSAEDWLNPEFWQQENAVVGQSKGRNTVWFVSDGHREFVLRHYYRGGLPGRLLTDQFIFTGIENTRSIAEFNLLLQMDVQNLPVPKPVAAMVCRSGMIYRASILIERIAGAQDVFQMLCSSALNAASWYQIGAMIGAFHRAGIYHSDLNCHNILWQETKGEGKPWLIDFDRCEVRQGHKWKSENIARLKRSLEKEQRLQPEFYWQESDWQTLLQGYQASSNAD